MKQLTHAKTKRIVTNAQREYAARLVIDENMTLEDAVEQAGLGSVQMAKTAVAAERARRERALEVDPATFARGVRDKFDATLRAYKRDLDAAFAKQLHDEVLRRMEKVLLPIWHKRIKEAEAVVAARKGVMTKATFRKIAAALHPDFNGDRTEAFSLFTDLETVLLNEREAPSPPTELPATVADLLKRRRRPR